MKNKIIISKKNNKKNTIKINPIISFTSFIKRYNFILFIVIAVGGLIFAILLLTEILTQPVNNLQPASTSSTSSDTVTFDQTTINRINNLKTSDNNTNPVLPSGRINPFSE